MRKKELFQGKTEEQLKSSYIGAFFGMLGMLILILLSILFNLL